MSDIANIVIIGGGVVGLAIAAELSRQEEDIFLLEAQPRPGLGTSTRNSGVIHAGIYYPTGTLKARHCVEGARLLYEFCARQNIPHRRAGKIIVGQTVDDLPMLERLKTQANANDAPGMEMIDRGRIRKLEPNIDGYAALYSPHTGLLEPEELVKNLARIATSNGASILTDTPVIGVDIEDGILTIRTPREEVGARTIINSAGLHADDVARLFGYDRHTIYPCRGEYAETVQARSNLVNGLVYPVPAANGHGLGVHFTRTLDGSLLLGPNAHYIERKDDYESGRATIASFHEAAIGMLPQLRLEDLRLGYSGIRPKLVPADGAPFADFVIERDPQWPNVIHLLGIESPGLTSCLSIARQIAGMVAESN